LIIEAITPGETKLGLPVRDEETAATETAPKCGVRVPEATFAALACDQNDDGIIQKNRFGEKRRGKLTVDYHISFGLGYITKW
jgi:hypothetical protein